MMKKVLAIAIMTLLLSACGAKEPDVVSLAETSVSSVSTEKETTTKASIVQEEGKKDLSGQYNIEEFLTLMRPMMEDAQEKLEYTTEDDYEEVARKVIDEGLRELGFAGGEEIVLTGKLSMVLVRSDSEYGNLILETKDGSDSWTLGVEAESLRKLAIVEDGTNIKVHFAISEINESGFLDVTDTQILYPNSIEYIPNCDVGDKHDAIIMGEVKELYEIAITQEESDTIREELAKDVYNFDSNLSLWYTNAPYYSHFAVIEDQRGNRVGAFLQEKYTDIPKIGDRIGVKGKVWEVDFETFSGKYIAPNLCGSYIFD